MKTRIKQYIIFFVSLWVCFPFSAYNSATSSDNYSNYVVFSDPIEPLIINGQTISTNFLKLCRFVMYSNPVSSGANVLCNNTKNYKSLTPFLIKDSSQTTKIASLIRRLLHSKNVVITRRKEENIIIVTGLGILYTAEEKKQIEKFLNAHLLDILNIANINAPKSINTNKARDNIVMHGRLIQLKEILQNSENDIPELIKQIKNIDTGEIGNLTKVNFGEQLNNEINKKLEELRKANKNTLKEFIIPLMTKLADLNKNNGTYTGTQAQKWIDGFEKSLENPNNEILDNIIKSITTPTYNALAGFADQKQSSDTRYISDLLHSEQFYIIYMV